MSLAPGTVPGSALGLGTYGAALGTGLQLASSLAQTMQASRAADYNAAAAQANAQGQAQAGEVEAEQYQRQAAWTRENMVLAQQAQAYREARVREQNERILGTSRAIVASSGLMMSGSPMAVYAETVRQQQYDILAERYQTGLQLRALSDQATMEDYAAQMARYGASERLRIGGGQAGVLRYGGAQAWTGGLLRTAGVGVSGLASTYSAYQREQYVTSGHVAPNPTLLGG